MKNVVELNNKEVNAVSGGIAVGTALAVGASVYFAIDQIRKYGFDACKENAKNNLKDNFSFVKNETMAAYNVSYNFIMTKVSSKGTEAAKEEVAL